MAGNDKSGNEKGGKVEFLFGVRLAYDFKNGALKHHEKGDKVSVARNVAEKYARMGLGRIVADSAPVEVKG